MTASKSSMRIGRYRREDYARVLEIMADREEFHDTYEEWLAEAERAELHLIATEGYDVVRIMIDPRQFPVWCLLRGLSLDAEARSRFTSEALREVTKGL